MPEYKSWDQRVAEAEDRDWPEARIEQLEKKLRTQKAELERSECEVIGTARGLVERFELNGALNVEFWVKELKRAIERLDEAREKVK